MISEETKRAIDRQPKVNYGIAKIISEQYGASAAEIISESQRLGKFVKTRVSREKALEAYVSGIADVTAEDGKEQVPKKGINGCIILTTIIAILGGTAWFFYNYVDGDLTAFVVCMLIVAIFASARYGVITGIFCTAVAGWIVYYFEFIDKPVECLIHISLFDCVTNEDFDRMRYPTMR